MIDAPDLQEFKAFANISTTDFDETILMLIDAATAYCNTAIGPDAFALDARGKLCVLMLATFWFEQREAVTDAAGMTRRVPLHLRSLLHQLRAGRLEPGVPEQAQ